MFHITTAESTAWEAIESYSLNFHFPLKSDKPQNFKKISSNPVVKYMIVSGRIKKYVSVRNLFHFLSEANLGQIWVDRGIGWMKDIFGNNGNLLMFVLAIRYNIPCKHFFKYLQLRSFIRAKQGQSMLISPLFPLQKILMKNLFRKVSYLNSMKYWQHFLLNVPLLNSMHGKLIYRRK